MNRPHSFGACVGCLDEIDALREQVAAITAERDHWKASHASVNATLDAVAASLEAQVEAARSFAQRKERDVCAEIAYGMADDWTCPNCDSDTAHDLASEIDHAIRARSKP